MIAPHHGHRLGQAELHPSRGPGGKFLGIEQAHIGFYARRTAIKVDEGIVLQRPRSIGQEAQARV